MSIEKFLKASLQEQRSECIHHEPVIFGEPAMFLGGRGAIARVPQAWMEAASAGE
jgi:hypothetical protein